MLTATPRILIADDHPLCGDALEIGLKAQSPGAVVDRAATLREAEALADGGVRYDLFLLDLMLPDAEGFTGLLSLRWRAPRTPVVIISAREEPDIVERARQLGAHGYISKAMPVLVMLRLVAAALQGERCFPAAPASRAPEGLTDRLAGLTPTQMKILNALASGRLNKQIAADMDLTEATVKTHVSAVFRKLRVKNRTQAVLALRAA